MKFEGIYPPVITPHKANGDEARDELLIPGQWRLAQAIGRLQKSPPDMLALQAATAHTVVVHVALHDRPEKAVLVSRERNL